MDTSLTTFYINNLFYRANYRASYWASYRASYFGLLYRTKNTNEIMEYIGLKYVDGSSILKPIWFYNGLLELTIPNKPKSPKSKI